MAQPGQAGFWAVLVLALAPLLHVLGIGLLPDTLLVFLTALLMGLTLDLMDPAAVRRPGPWLALGVVLGLAGLSKYTAILAVPAVAVCLLQAHGWRIVAQPAGCGWRWPSRLLLVLPVAYWNARQPLDLVRLPGPAWRRWWLAGRPCAALCSCCNCWSMARCCCGAWLGVRQGVAAPLRGLLLFFARALCGAGRAVGWRHQPAALDRAGLGGAGTVCRHRAGAMPCGRGRRWVIAGLAVAQGAAVRGAAGPDAHRRACPLSPTPRARAIARSPPTRLPMCTAGTPPASAPASWRRSTACAVWACRTGRLASRLGWYARPLPVHVLEDRFDQFDLWAGDLPVGGDTLLVDWSQLAYTVPLGANGFADCTLLDTQEVRRLGTPIASFRFYACHQWSGHPQPRLLGAP